MRKITLEKISTKKTNVWLGFKALFQSAFAFSLMTVCVKHLGNRIPVAEIVFFRALISIFITRIMIIKASVSPWGNRKVLLVIRGLLGTLALFCVFEAIARLPLSIATIIQYTYPTFTALAGGIFLAESNSPQIWIAVILGWIGIGLVVSPEDSDISHIISSGDILIALTGAMFTALAYICVRKLSSSEHPLVIVYYFPLISIPITLPLLISSGVWPQGIEWVWIIGIGLLTQLGQIWITEGIALIPVGQASAINYIQVVFATIWGFVLFEEVINMQILLGSICILGATIISIRSKRAKQISN